LENVLDVGITSSLQVRWCV